MRPRIFVTEDKIEGLRSLEEVREAIADGRPRELWEQLLEVVERQMRAPPLVPESMFPGRDKNQARHANRDYGVVHAAGDRVTCAAFAALVAGDTRYRDAALEQMETLFDERKWPEWRDLSHPWVAADLRTGQLAQALGLAYDWLYQSTTDSQRREVIEGIDRCGVQRYLKAVEENAWWLTHQNNWQTVVVGGLGIAGMALGEDHPESERLLDLSLGRMRDYLTIYGPDGEFNENVGYAGATRAPVTYFSAYQYYNAGVFGHNVLMFGREEMAVGEDRRAEIAEAEFDDEKGGVWTIDLTGTYDGVLSVRRSVIHLTPAVVAVLDEARLPELREISLRWHTVDRAEPDESGSFTVTSNGVHLSARVVALDDQPVQFHRREHEYRPPFDKGRLGDTFEQRHESYVEAALDAPSCRLLTLFAVIGPGEAVSNWLESDNAWTVDLQGMQPIVTVSDGLFAARDDATGGEWHVPL